MPLDEADLKYLWDMLRAAELAVEIAAQSGKGEYLTDRKTQLATERAVEIAGEAARRVSEDARRQIAGVEWGAIVATRHILAHEYDDVDYEELWRILTVHAPKLILLLRPILDANPPAPESKIDPSSP